MKAPTLYAIALRTTGGGTLPHVARKPLIIVPMTGRVALRTASAIWTGVIWGGFPPTSGPGGSAVPLRSLASSMAVVPFLRAADVNTFPAPLRPGIHLPRPGRVDPLVPAPHGGVVGAVGHQAH